MLFARKTKSLQSLTLPSWVCDNFDPLMALPMWLDFYCPGWFCDFILPLGSCVRPALTGIWLLLPACCISPPLFLPLFQSDNGGDRRRRATRRRSHSAFTTKWSAFPSVLRRKTLHAAVGWESERQIEWSSAGYLIAWSIPEREFDKFRPTLLHCVV